MKTHEFMLGTIVFQMSEREFYQASRFCSIHCVTKMTGISGDGTETLQFSHVHMRIIRSNVYFFHVYYGKYHGDFIPDVLWHSCASHIIPINTAINSSPHEKRNSQLGLKKLITELSILVHRATVRRIRISRFFSLLATWKPTIFNMFWEQWNIKSTAWNFSVLSFVL